ncbi:MAG: CinA family protein [Verrucomicrobia bacterium]|nr:CinA family protein [Verrucomicrobiota bacterium]
MNTANLKPLLLCEPRWTLAVAESLTCGRVQARIGAVSGASEYFLGGVTAYSLDQKVKLLGVDRAAAEPVNSVSAAVAEQMARGVCELFGTQVGAATTGYAEPSTAQQVVHPFAWWAVARRPSTSSGQAGEDFVVRSGRLECPGATRVETQERVAEAVIVSLVAFLREARGA